MKNNRQGKALLRWFMVTLFLLPVSALPVSAQKSKSPDTEKLGKALDYFTSGMYHESLLLFKALDKEYTLNARFHAFMGLCYYYEWDYQQACTYLDEAIPKIESLAPHERSVYYFANAESHFNLEQYAEAIPFYEQHIMVCYPNEKADSFYRIGFCYMFHEEWANACENFESALSYYTQHPEVKSARSRIPQLKTMIEGCREKLQELQESSHI